MRKRSHSPSAQRATFVLIPTKQGPVPQYLPRAPRRRSAQRPHGVRRSFRHEHPILCALLVALIVLFVLAALAS
jgi:hypothetical protein